LNAILPNGSELWHPLVGFNRERWVPPHQHVARTFQNAQLRTLGVDFDVIGLR
jgi:hypothetical protein